MGSGAEPRTLKHFCAFSAEKIASEHCYNKFVCKSAPRSEAKASGWLQSAVTTTHLVSMRRSLILQTLYFLSSSVVSRAFSALCMYSKFGHHPRLPLCQISFFAVSVAELASGENGVLTHQLNHPACLMTGNRSFRFGTSNMTGCHRDPKRKLRAGYRAPSLPRTLYCASSSVVSRAFSALCACSQFRIILIP